MNEQQNVELIERAYAGFPHGDIEAILDLLTPDVEWRLDGPDAIPYARTFVGPGQVATFFAALATTQTDHKLSMSEFIAQGDKVASLGRYSAVVTGTGKRIDCAVAHVFTIRDGKIARFLDFGDTAQMAEAYRGEAAAARG